MDYGELLKALLATSAIHTGGHFDAAGKSRFNADMKLNLKGLEEHYDNSGMDFRDMNKIDAGGFTAQSKVANAEDNSTMDIATGAHKLAYSAGIVKKLGSISDDVDALKSHGGKYAREALAISALSDILHGMGAIKGRFVFIAPEGAPGIAYTRRW